MTFSIKNLDHVVVCVSDLGRALRFYTDVLGCKEERRVDPINLVQLRAGQSMIDLQLKTPRPDNGSHNMDHFAIRIDPFDEAEPRADLDHHGVEAGKVDPRYGAGGQGPSIYIKDPDGNTVELKGPPETPARVP